MQLIRKRTGRLILKTNLVRLCHQKIDHFNKEQLFTGKVAIQGAF
ncbi:Uncharacterised protein [Vibrio cholerae]|nr:Uncharacterised protein [Vibrio cholerae]